MKIMGKGEIVFLNIPFSSTCGNEPGPVPKIQVLRTGVRTDVTPAPAITPKRVMAINVLSLSALQS